MPILCIIVYPKSKYLFNVWVSFLENIDRRDTLYVLYKLAFLPFNNSYKIIKNLHDFINACMHTLLLLLLHYCLFF